MQGTVDCATTGKIDNKDAIESESFMAPSTRVISKRFHANLSDRAFGF
jgi:hypothetical protein